MSENRIQPGGVDDDVKQAATTDDEAILDEARRRYKMCADNESANFADARDDLKFLSGGANQWEQESYALRQAERRPCLTVNNLPTFLHKVTNEQRQNTPSIRVQPVGSGANKETAEILQGLVRHIQYQSNADIAYDTAVNSSASIGYGVFRIATEYERDDSFDQKIVFKRIRNPLAVHIDPMSTELDGSDMQFAFVDCIESREEFKRKWPDAQANATTLNGQVAYQGWLSDKTVTVTEYYRIKKEKKTLCRLTDGSVGWKDDLPKEQYFMIADTRDSIRETVEWFKITAVDVLERTEIKCRWIPVFPVYGDEIDIDGKVIRSGIIRNAKDPFKMYNLWITLATEEVAMRPKTPYIGAVGQFDTRKKEWAAANNRSYAYLEYDPVTVDGNIAPPPQRQPMADVPSGMLAMAMHASDNKKSTTGLFDASLGARGSASSGIQEREQQQQGEISNYHYADNLNKSVCHAGRCIIDMIPHYYDTARTVRIMGEDESAKAVQINAPFEKRDKMGGVETVFHDVRVGDYDVTVSTGPSYTSKRQEAAEFLTSAMQAAKDPATSIVLSYGAMSNQDIPGADKMSRMLETLLPPGAKAVVDEDKDDDQEQMIQTPKGPLPISQAPEAIAGMEQHIQQLEQTLQQMQTDAAQIKADKAALDAERVALQQERKMLDQQKGMVDQSIQLKAVEESSELDKREYALNLKAAEIKFKEQALKDHAAAALDEIEMAGALAASEAEAGAAESAPAPSGGSSSPKSASSAAPRSSGASDKALAQTQAMIARALQAIADSQSKKGMNLQIAAPSGQVYSVKVD